MPIMDRFKHGMDLTKFKADQLMRINHAQGEITNLRTRIGGIQRQLGVVAIELHMRGALSNKELEDLCLEIDGVNQAIAAKENEIAAIRAEVPPQYVEPVAVPAVPAPVPANPCPSCQFDIPPGSEFCPNCGRPVDKPPTPAEKACPNCDHLVPERAAFCPNCGFNLSQPAAPAPAEEKP